MTTVLMIVSCVVMFGSVALAASRITDREQDIVCASIHLDDYIKLLNHSTITKTIEVNGETTEMYIEVDGEEYHITLKEATK